MRLEGKISKVAICPTCQKMILACHIDYIYKSIEKEFTQFTNEGFTVKIETAIETKSRKFGFYKNCKTHLSK